MNRRRAATVAGLLAVSGSVVARRAAAGPRQPIPELELSPGWRGGAGSPLLLLHGLGGIWRAWSPVLPHLEPHHDVIVPTLPGHSGGPPLDPSESPSVEALADGIERELDRLDLERIHIAGNSLGGWLGMELARRGRARTLVLFSPAGAWQSQRAIEQRATAIRLSVGALGLCAPYADRIAGSPMLRRALLGAQVAHPDRVPPEMLAAVIRAGGSAPVIEPLLRRLPQRQVDPLPADRDYPVRLVWAAKDKVLPFDGFGTAMADRIPGVDLVRLPGVGHVPMSDDPSAVARMILEVTCAADDAPVPAEGDHA